GPGGQPQVDADILLVQNIRTFTPDGEPALVIGQISGEDIDVTAAFGETRLAGFADYRKNLEHAELKAKSLTLSDIQHAGTGAIIKEVRFDPAGQAQGLDVTVDRAKGDTSVSVESGRFTVSGVNMPAYSTLLNAELERLRNIPAESRTKAQNDR